MEYVLEDTIHLGLYTRIIRARHPQNGQPVALKMVMEEVVNERLLQRLRQEYGLLREVQGPGIISVVDLVPWGMGLGLALVMELWGDGSLDRILQREPLSIDKALRLGTALAQAIGHVHRQGIVHREHNL